MKGTSKPASIEKTETFDDFLIVQIGSKITVKDVSGDIVDMEVQLSADGKTVSIHPSAEYEKGELYHITISDVRLLR